MEIKGKIIHVSDIQEFASGFKKRTVVVEAGDQYPNPIPVELHKEKADGFDGAEGDDVTFAINIRGREYDGKYYANLVGWRWDLVKQSKPEPQPQPEPDLRDLSMGSTDESEDIPF